jgi:hypothetical protein
MAGAGVLTHRNLDGIASLEPEAKIQPGLNRMNTARKFGTRRAALKRFPAFRNPRGIGDSLG